MDLLLKGCTQTPKSLGAVVSMGYSFAVSWKRIAFFAS